MILYLLTDARMDELGEFHDAHAVTEKGLAMLRGVEKAIAIHVKNRPREHAVCRILPDAVTFTGTEEALLRETYLVHGNLFKDHLDPRCLVRCKEDMPFHDATGLLLGKPMKKWFLELNKCHGIAEMILGLPLASDQPVFVKPEKPEAKRTWHVPDVHPTKEQCEENDGRFLAYDGNRKYPVWFDQYDKVFKVSCDIGGMPLLRKDECITYWACYPAGPY